MTEVSLLFERLFSSLNIPLGKSELAFLGNKYQYIDYNIYQFVGDLTDYDIAHLIVPIEALTKDTACYPVLCKLKNRHRYCIIEQLNDERVSVYCPWDLSLNSACFSDLASIVDKWVVLAEPTVFTNTGIKRSFLKAHKNRFLLATAMAGLFCLSFLSGIALALLVSLSLAGIYICYELFMQKFGKSSTWVQEVCNKLSNADSCNQVINSSYSNFMGFIPLHYLGGFYFMGFFLYLLMNVTFFGSFAPTLLCVGINLIALFFGFVFLCLQVFVLKKICFLCTSIFFVVLVLNGVLYSYNIKEVYDVMAIALAATTSAALVLLWDKYVVFQKRSESLQTKLYRWLTDSHIFSEAHKSLKPIIDTNEGKLFINFEQGRRRVDLLISDTCIYCERYFKDILKLLFVSDEYYVALHLESKKDTRQKLRWLNEQLTRTADNFNDYLVFSIHHPATNAFSNVKFEKLLNTLERNEKFDEVSSAISNKLNTNSYPMAFLDGKQINTLYDSKAIKRHLVLLKYK